MTDILGYMVQAFTPFNLLMALIGTAMGMLVGAIPGLSPPMAIAMMLPITYTMEPLPALLLLIGIYNASKLAGAFPAVLLRTPGTPSAAVTCLDGHAMAERGKAGLAIGYSAYASAFGGFFGFLSCILLAPLVAKIALRTEPADIALVGIVGLIMVCIFSRGSIIKGLIGTAFGLLISTIGADPVNGALRYTFGIRDFIGGIPFISALVGVFAVGTVLTDIKIIGTRTYVKHKDIEIEMPKFIKTLVYWKDLLIGSVYGVLVGAVPGVGAEASTWLAYATSKKKSKHPELYGTGIPEGILAAESSNNAVTGGALIPMLTLGIPGDSSTAIMLGAIMLQGLNPGVTLFRDSPVLTYGMITGLLTSSIFMVIIALFAAKPFVSMLNRDRSWIFPFILIFSSIGAFATSNTVFPVKMALVFGIFAFFMQKYGFPLVTMVLAIILGPVIETNARLALIFSSGSLSTFYSTWPRILIILVILYLIISELITFIKNNKKTSLNN